MANSNFVVHNGLTVGPLTIDATTGSITTSGNITTTGTTTTFINEIVTGTEAVYGILTANAGVASTSTTTGTFQVTGGAGISGAIYNGGVHVSAGNIVAAASTTSTNTTTGALTVVGGTGIGGNLNVGGLLNVTGNVTFSGQQVAHDTGTLTVYDSVLDLHTYGNLAAWASDDGKDIGIRMHYYKGADTLAFLGWENTTQTLQYLQSATETSSNVTGTFGNVQFGSLTLANSTASTSATTGALIVTGGAGITGNVFTSGWIVPTANTTQNLGTTTNWWGTLYGVSTQAKYADLAENYQADAAYHAGQVVEFGGTYEVTLATPDTRRVAGVVSTNPAHLMNGGLSGINVVPLALQGRVPCNVIGPVAKGDIMVSAGFGYAKTNNNAQVGQVIGKALADFSGAKGVIEVVVGRQ